MMRSAIRATVIWIVSRFSHLAVSLEENPTGFTGHDRWREMERCVLMMKSFSVALHKSGITDFWLDDTLQKSL